MANSPRKLRSSDWFGGAGKNGFMQRSWMKNQGLPDHVFDGRPVIGICNTWSELTPCNAHLAASPSMSSAASRGRRLSARISGHVAGRIQSAADRHAVPQSCQHGCRGIDPRQSDRRRGAAGGLRQDHAGAADGGGKLRPAHHRGVRRADAERQLPRRGHRLRHRRVALLRRAEGGQDDVEDLWPRRGAEPLGRQLHDHGHRLDHGEHGRGAGHRAHRQCGHSRRRFPPRGAGPYGGGASSIWYARMSACRRS